MHSAGRGELLVSLCYQPAANRLTVVVLKARNLPKMDVTGLSGELHIRPQRTGPLSIMHAILCHGSNGKRVLVKREPSRGVANFQMENERGRKEEWASNA